MLLMHDDSPIAEDVDAWAAYLDGLRREDRLAGGSSISTGVSHRKFGTPAPCADHLVGYLIVHAAGPDGVPELLAGNPVYEAGGTVEIRELIED